MFHRDLSGPDCPTGRPLVVSTVEYSRQVNVSKNGANALNRCSGGELRSASAGERRESGRFGHFAPVDMDTDLGCRRIQSRGQRRNPGSYDSITTLVGGEDLTKPDEAAVEAGWPKPLTLQIISSLPLNDHTLLSIL